MFTEPATNQRVEFAFLATSVSNGMNVVVTKSGTQPLWHADVSVTEKHYVKPESKVSAAAMAKFQRVLKAKKKAQAVQKRKDTAHHRSGLLTYFYTYFLCGHICQSTTNTR